MGATNWQLPDTAPFLHAELHGNVSGARVGRVLIYVCVKCGHASAFRRLDGRLTHLKAKRTGHALNARARMLGTTLNVRISAAITYTQFCVKSNNLAVLILKIKQMLTLASGGGGGWCNPRVFFVASVYLTFTPNHIICVY